VPSVFFCAIHPPFLPLSFPSSHQPLYISINNPTLPSFTCKIGHANRRKTKRSGTKREKVRGGDKNPKPQLLHTTGKPPRDGVRPLGLTTLGLVTLALHGGMHRVNDLERGR